MDALLTGYGDTRKADEQLCVIIGADLERNYPGHMWFVGCDHGAGTIAIDLPYEKPIGMERYGYLLHIATVVSPGGQKAVMRAGGELLERFGLKRGAATADSAIQAAEHGLLTDGHRNKSRH